MNPIATALSTLRFVLTLGSLTLGGLAFALFVEGWPGRGLRELFFALLCEAGLAYLRRTQP